jgi:hypothetical protein
LRIAFPLVGRTLASAAVLGVTVVGVVLFGPRPTPVYADIYYEIAEASGLLPAPPGADGAESTPRAVSVNGEIFHYVVGRSRTPVSALLDHFQSMLAGPLVAADGRSVDLAFRWEGSAVGMVGGLARGRETSTDAISERVTRFARSRVFGDLGAFHVVVVLSGPRSTYLRFWPDPEARFDRILPSHQAESSGQDIPGVGRPARSRRLFTIEPVGERFSARTVFYRADDSAEHAFRDMTAALLNRGWVDGGAVERTGIGHFVRGDDVLFVAASPEPAGCVVSVVHRAGG